MFFEVHHENRIGYKCLTDPDLGRKKTSHNSHIGLCEGVLTFLSNKDIIKDAMVIYDGKAEILPLYFDRIRNADGTYRSPKIRSGNGQSYSVVSFVRKTVKLNAPNGTWYLIWFGLKSGQPVFLLVNERSDTCYDLCARGMDLHQSCPMNHLGPNHPAFSALIAYLEQKINIDGICISEELEIIAQTGKTKVASVRRYNLERALLRAANVGRTGEEAIDLFFRDQKNKGLILDYSWVNQSGESGLPYDFYVEACDGECTFLDVKTTEYRFEQKMIFSNHEIEFASKNDKCYRVYRVYCDSNGVKHLRICKDVAGLFKEIYLKTNEYKYMLGEMTEIQHIKLTISPYHQSLAWSEQIALSDK